MNSLMAPYQPCDSCSSPCSCCAYDGCRSSRLGGRTLITPPLVGRKPMGVVELSPLTWSSAPTMLRGESIVEWDREGRSCWIEDSLDDLCHDVQGDAGVTKEEVIHLKGVEQNICGKLVDDSRITYERAMQKIVKCSMSLTCTCCDAAQDGWRNHRSALRNWGSQQSQAHAS